jgi:hypothetical protein
MRSRTRRSSRPVSAKSCCATDASRPASALKSLATYRLMRIADTLVCKQRMSQSEAELRAPSVSSFWQFAAERQSITPHARSDRPPPGLLAERISLP